MERVGAVANDIRTVIAACAGMTSKIVMKPSLPLAVTGTIDTLGTTTMKLRAWVLASTLVLAPLGAWAATPPAASTGTQAALAHQLWSVWGGEVGVRWNRDLAGDVGMRISAPKGALDGLSSRAHERFALRRSGSLAFHVENGYFRGFDDGSLQAEGGYVITLPDGSKIDFSDFRLRSNASDPLILDFVGSDGKAWFYIDRLMYELTHDNKVLDVAAMDMRISAQLAQRIGHPEVAGWAIADVKMVTDVQRSGDGTAALAAVFHWTGDPAPNGGVYETDLFMKSFQMSYTRCQGCTGTAGTGSVVFTPSSTLKNNVNNGTLATTIPGQGEIGTSTALWTSGVPWNQKFTGNKPPYNNDQHPFLIWNLYRTNADGSIEQIGRSGVKHAWLTTNGSCADSTDHDSHVLGRGCSDTYGTGNNDTSSDLGPRSEIIPALGLWGRCGSIYDPDCTLSIHSGGNGPYDQRMIVREQQISPALNTGATYLFESWYIARDDINPYNSMATVTGVPNWTGSTWSPGGGANYKLGPAIDRWVDPANPGTNARSTELANKEGRAKLAVKVTDLGNGTWRYDYAVMNFDFARAVTSGGGSNPDMPDTNTLKVLSNRGFNRFSVALPDGAVVSSTRFSDGDVNAVNDWTVDTASGAVSWNAPTSGNTLDWGTLFSFSLTVNKPPVTGSGELGIAQAGSPAVFTLATLSPSAAATPIAVASVTPASLSFSLNASDSSSAPLVIGNTGAAGSSLSYAIAQASSACSTPSAVSWLSATPVSGSVVDGATATISVSVNSAGLAAGGYAGKLCLTTNDPNQPMIEVPVTLAVNGVSTYTVGGTVNGLVGSGFALKLNDGSALPITTNGAFTFPDNLTANTGYSVTIGTEPANPAQTCTIANSSGTIGSANVTNIVVTCVTGTPTTYTVGGTVSGLVGSGLKLKLNSGSNLPIGADGSFVFSAQLFTGASYAVTITGQPSAPAQTCTVASGSGTIGTASVSNVAVVCTLPDNDSIFTDGFELAP